MTTREKFDTAINMLKEIYRDGIIHDDRGEDDDWEIIYQVESILEKIDPRKLDEAEREAEQELNN